MQRFRNRDYDNMHFIYGLSNRNAHKADEEYLLRYQNILLPTAVCLQRYIKNMYKLAHFGCNINAGHSGCQGGGVCH